MTRESNRFHRHGALRFRGQEVRGRVRAPGYPHARWLAAWVSRKEVGAVPVSRWVTVAAPGTVWRYTRLLSRSHPL